jgi:hypothetical protein
LACSFSPEWTAPGNRDRRYSRSWWFLWSTGMVGMVGSVVPTIQLPALPARRRPPRTRNRCRIAVGPWCTRKRAATDGPLGATAPCRGWLAHYVCYEPVI